MSTNEFLVMYVCVLVPMLVCRCAPLFLLKGRELSSAVREAIELIPPAAFAALVANDLFQDFFGFVDSKIMFLHGLILFTGDKVSLVNKIDDFLFKSIDGVLSFKLIEDRDSLGDSDLLGFSFTFRDIVQALVLESLIDVIDI